MKQNTFVEIIEDQTRRALWEVKNVIDCVPDDLWNRLYCDMPCWKHIYHMLHSLDLWYINPRDTEFKEPSFHKKRKYEDIFPDWMMRSCRNIPPDASTAGLR